MCTHTHSKAAIDIFINHQHYPTIFPIQIWSMVQRVQRCLTHGYSIQTWLDEDFLYVYYLWINIPNNPLGVSTMLCSLRVFIDYTAALYDVNRYYSEVFKIQFLYRPLFS